MSHNPNSNRFMNDNNWNKGHGNPDPFTGQRDNKPNFLSAERYRSNTKIKMDNIPGIRQTSHVKFLSDADPLFGPNEHGKAPEPMNKGYRGGQGGGYRNRQGGGMWNNNTNHNARNNKAGLGHPNRNNSMDNNRNYRQRNNNNSGGYTSPRKDSGGYNSYNNNSRSMGPPITPNPINNIQQPVVNMPMNGAPINVVPMQSNVMSAPAGQMISVPTMAPAQGNVVQVIPQNQPANMVQAIGRPQNNFVASAP